MVVVHRDWFLAKACCNLPLISILLPPPTVSVRLFKRLAAGVLLTVGGLFLIAAISIPFDQDEGSGNKTEQFLGCLLLGIPSTTLGGWLAWTLHREAQVRDGDRLRSAFFQLARETDGCMSVMQFAMAANLAGDRAKEYLDERATEFGANFSVDEQGGIFYRFPIKGTDPNDEVGG